MSDEPTQPVPGGSASPRLLKGKFRLERLIGKGGFGEVWEAQDIDLHRAVAVKVIPIQDRDGTEQFEKRFRREARAIAGLSHPNIISLHEVGEDDGVAYLVMELVQGESLRQRLSRVGKLPSSQVVAIGTAVCDALSYAHSRGILHRDIKPENVLMRDDGILKVADFGLAKVLHGETSTVSTDGSVTGTPSYMSPEQVRGEPLDIKSDVFSVSAMLYELLTGRKPFAGDSIAGTVYRILNEDPPAPHELAPGIKPELSDVVLRGLAKERDQRWASCSELKSGLLNEETPTRALSGRVVAEASAPPRRRRPLLGITAGVLLLGFLAILCWATRDLSFGPMRSPITKPKETTIKKFFEEPPPSTPGTSSVENELRQLGALREQLERELELTRANRLRQEELAAERTESQKPPSDEELVRGAVTTFVEAGQTEDSASILGLLSDDVKVVVPAGVIQEREVIEDYLSRRTADGELAALVLSDDVVVTGETAQVVLVGASHDWVSRERLTLQLQKKSAGWRVTRVESDIVRTDTGNEIDAGVDRFRKLLEADDPADLVAFVGDGPFELEGQTLDGGGELQPRLEELHASLQSAFFVRTVSHLNSDTEAVANVELMGKPPEGVTGLLLNLIHDPFRGWTVRGARMLRRGLTVDAQIRQALQRLGTGCRRGEPRMVMSSLAQQVSVDLPSGRISGHENVRRFIQRQIQQRACPFSELSSSSQFTVKELNEARVQVTAEQVLTPDRIQTAVLEFSKLDGVWKITNIRIR